MAVRRGGDVMNVKDGISRNLYPCMSSCISFRGNVIAGDVNGLLEPIVLIKESESDCYHATQLSDVIHSHTQTHAPTHL